MIRDLAFAITAHALLAAIRSAHAVVETVAIVWDDLQAPLPEDDPLDDGRFAQKPEAVAPCRRCDAMANEAQRLASRAELESIRLRANLDEMRAQRDQALEALAGRVGVPRDRLTVRRAARERIPIGGADAQALEGALQQIERELAEEAVRNRDAAADAAQNLSAAQAVIADLRRELDEANQRIVRIEAARLELDTSLLLIRRAIGTSPALDGIGQMREMLGAREGETLLAAVQRATQAVSHG